MWKSPNSVCTHVLHDVTMFSSGVAIQGVSWPRRSTDGETETEANPYDFHFGTAQGTGAGLPGDTLSRYIHKGRDRHEDRSDRGQGTGRSKEIRFFFLILTFVFKLIEY